MQVIISAVPGLIFRHRRPVPEAVTKDGEVIALSAGDGTSSTCRKDRLVIALETGSNIHHHNMSGIAEDAESLISEVTECAVGMMAETAGITDIAMIAATGKNMILRHRAAVFFLLSRMIGVQVTEP